MLANTTTNKNIKNKRHINQNRNMTGCNLTCHHNLRYSKHDDF